MTRRGFPMRIPVMFLIMFWPLMTAFTCPQVDLENDSDQNAFENYIIRRMVADPNIAPVQHFHKQWQTRRRRAIESNDGYQLRCLPYFFIIGQ